MVATSTYSVSSNCKYVQLCLPYSTHKLDSAILALTDVRV